MILEAALWEALEDIQKSDDDLAHLENQAPQSPRDQVLNP